MNNIWRLTFACWHCTCTIVPILILNIKNIFNYFHICRLHPFILSTIPLLKLLSLSHCPYFLYTTRISSHLTLIVPSQGSHTTIQNTYTILNLPKKNILKSQPFKVSITITYNHYLLHQIHFHLIQTCLKLFRI